MVFRASRLTEPPKVSAIKNSHSFRTIIGTAGNPIQGCLNSGVTTCKIARARVENFTGEIRINDVQQAEVRA